MIEINGDVVKSVTNYRPRFYKNLKLLSGSGCQYTDGPANVAAVDVNSEYFKFENLEGI